MADDQTNALSIGSNLDATSNDLDTTVGHGHDFGDGLTGLLFRSTDGLGELNLLSVNLDDHTLLTLLLVLLLLLLLLTARSAWDELDLVSTTEEDGDDLTGLLLNVLDEDSHGVLAGAVLGQNGLTSLDGLLVEGVGDVVEGVDVVALKGTLRVGLGAEKTVLDVLVDGLRSSGWEDGADQLVGFHVLELEDRVGLVDLDGDKLLVRGHASLDLEFSLLDGRGLRVGILLHVDVSDSLEHVFHLVGHVLDTLGDVGVLQEKIKIRLGPQIQFKLPSTKT